MNLVGGKLLSDEQAKKTLPHLEEQIQRTLQGNFLTTEQVIEACDLLINQLGEEHIQLLIDLGLSRDKAVAELTEVKTLLSRNALTKRLEIELGGIGETAIEDNTSHCLQPLGVLLHIAAGNVDALPAYSVIEGLLTGNINILKLPGQDDGLSIRIIQELIKIEPLIASYVYIYDFPSADTDAIRRMADSADAIVVWGGDAAVRAIRANAEPNTRIIEWGHKISFAYISGAISDKELKEIAYNICETNQLYCNSCQGIYLNTSSFNEVMSMAERFLPILDQVARETAIPANPFISAQKTLELYTEEIESRSFPETKKKLYRTTECSILAMDNSHLIMSYQMRNCWIKPLPKKEILSYLRPHKNHLQTVALYATEEDRDTISQTLMRTGIVRITNGLRMSKQYTGNAHDGKFSLREYMKIVSFEY